MNILVLDDSQVSRLFLVNYLQEVLPDATILQAGSGDEAVAIANSQPVELAVLDYNVPDLNGLLVAKQIRLRHPTAVQALLTGNIQRTVQEAAEQAGLLYYRKPITAELAQHIVRDALAARANLR